MRSPILTIAFAAAACGGKSTDLEGIYALDAWNQNSASCADPGGDVLGLHDPNVFIALESFFGQTFLTVVECPDPATCAAEANEEDTLHLGQFLLDQGSDSKGWTGTTSFSFGPDVDNNCSGGVSKSTLTVDAGGLAVTIRDEEIDVPSFPPRDGECEPEDAVEASEDLPCTSLEVVHATFVSEF
jgi:hypothetical protein